MIELSKELVELVARGPSTDEPIHRLLKEFSDYARRHDELEEGLLAANDCPTLAEHRRVHRAAEAELDRWMASASTESLDRTALVAYFQGWMEHHLTETDMPVSGYMHD